MSNHEEGKILSHHYLPYHKYLVVVASISWQIGGFQLKKHQNGNKLSLKISGLIFKQAAQAKFVTKDIHKTHNFVHKSRMQIFFRLNFFRQLRMSFYSPQSISAPPDRLRRSWDWTALATPSPQCSSDLRKLVQISSKRSTRLKSSATDGSRVKHYQKLFSPRSEEAQIGMLANFRQLIGGNMQGVTPTQCLCITLTLCSPVLSSNTPVEFVPRYWTPFHPCNSKRSNFYAA